MGGKIGIKGLFCLYCIEAAIVFILRVFYHVDEASHFSLKLTCTFTSKAKHPAYFFSRSAL